MHIVNFQLWLTGLPAALPQGTPSKPSPSTASPQSSWALRALKQNSAKQTDMLQSVLAKHLQGHALLAGNPVLVPVLGHNCIFRHVASCPCTATIHGLPKARPCIVE